MNTEEFVKIAKENHDNFYDYSKVEYINRRTKVCIICPIHGEFWQAPSKHLSGQGCPKCGKIKMWDKRGRCLTNEFIEKAREIHNDKYDYSKVEYVKSNEKVCIICPIHGEFWQTPNKHLAKRGCPECKNNKLKTLKSSNTDEFIEKARRVHGNKYDYSKVEYVNNSTKICIICPEHGEFWQTPNNHLRGKGCYQCNGFNTDSESRLYDAIKEHFNNCEIIYQYKNKELLGNLSIDIYIPKYNIAIEYQGTQHFLPSNTYGGFKTFVKQIKRDELKQEICINNNIKLFYFTYKKYTIPKNYFDIVYYDESSLFNEIDNIMEEKD